LEQLSLFLQYGAVADKVVLDAAQLPDPLMAAAEEAAAVLLIRMLLRLVTGEKQ
jgi:hypothetical protein